MVRSIRRREKYGCSGENDRRGNSESGQELFYDCEYFNQQLSKLNESNDEDELTKELIENEIEIIEFTKEYEQKQRISEFSYFFQSNEIESDMYILFERLMSILGLFYEQKRIGDVSKQSKIFDKCEYLFNQLSKIDPLYHTTLVRHNLIPSVFGLRWIRMLYAREYQLDEVISLWDAIFAFGQLLKLIDSLFIIKLLLLKIDFSTV